VDSFIVFRDESTFNLCAVKAEIGNLVRSEISAQLEELKIGGKDTLTSFAEPVCLTAFQKATVSRQSTDEITQEGASSEGAFPGVNNKLDRLGTEIENRLEKRFDKKMALMLERKLKLVMDQRDQGIISADTTSNIMSCIRTGSPSKALQESAFKQCVEEAVITAETVADEFMRKHADNRISELLAALKDIANQQQHDVRLKWESLLEPASGDGPHRAVDQPAYADGASSELLEVVRRGIEGKVERLLTEAENRLEKRLEKKFTAGIEKKAKALQVNFDKGSLSY
jgi:hypothetical protein